MQVEIPKNQTDPKVQRRKSGVKGNPLFLLRKVDLDEFLEVVASKNLKVAKSVTQESEFDSESVFVVVKDMQQAEIDQIDALVLAYKFFVKKPNQILDPNRRQCGCRGLPCSSTCVCLFCICHPLLKICV